MSGKYTPRYLSAEEKPKAKKKRSAVWGILCVVAVLCVSLLVGLLWPKDKEQTDAQINSSATESQMAAPDGYSAIQTVYGTLQVSSDCVEELRHIEVTQDNVAMEVFYMPMENGEWELFRIYFGDVNLGEQIGYFVTEQGNIPISVAVCTYSEEDFATEELYDRYHMLMGHLEAVLTSLRSDSRYIAAEEVSESTDAYQAVELIYWELELPASMEWEERNSNDAYRVDFYGSIGGIRVALYSIYFGEANAESVVGIYTVDNVEKTVCADTYSLEEQILDADEETKSAYYKLMRTINDVLQVIMASDGFVASIPE